MLYTLTSPPIVSLPRNAPMPSIGLHLSSNVYICSKGNALVCYSPPQGFFAGAPIPSLSTGLDLPTLSSSSYIE